MLWLVHALRRSREAPVGIFTRCQDAEDGDTFAAEIRDRADEGLGFYGSTSAALSERAPGQVGATTVE